MAALLVFALCIPAGRAATFNWPTTPAWPATGPANGTTSTVDYSYSSQGSLSVSVFNNTMTWNTGSPTIQTGNGRTVTGGTGNANNDLFLSVNPAATNASYAQVTINFNYSGGATGVAFTLWDVDNGPGFIDSISSIQATTTSGATIYPTITTGSTNALTGSGSTAVVNGTAGNNNDQAGGNVTFNFGVQAVRSVTFRWSNSLVGTLGNQWIGVSPITFTPVGTAFPEVGSAVGSLALCAGLICVARRRQRRADGAVVGA